MLPVTFAVGGILELFVDSVVRVRAGRPCWPTSRRLVGGARPLRVRGLRTTTGSDSLSAVVNGVGSWSHHESMTVDALLFLSFGGPEGPQEVRPFLENVTAGRGVPPERLDEVA